MYTHLDHLLAACLPELHTLQISHNRLSTADDLEHLTECHDISVLDLSHNKLNDPKILDIFERMSGLVNTFSSGLRFVLPVVHMFVVYIKWE